MPAEQGRLFPHGSDRCRPVRGLANEFVRAPARRLVISHRVEEKKGRDTSRVALPGGLERSRELRRCRSRPERIVSERINQAHGFLAIPCRGKIREQRFESRTIE